MTIEDSAIAIDALERDLDELVRTMDDGIEADALRELMALAAELDIEADETDEYTPFVYPH